jgi:acyl-CoA thioesterase-1
MWAGAACAPSRAADKPLKIVALGDSLSTGLGLPTKDAFPAKLTAALKAKGITAEVIDAALSGDTASGGLGRLEWSVPPDADAVILELGANDALRGIDPKVTRAALEEILNKLQARHTPVLLAGMLAPPNMGADYKRAFDSMYPDLAESHGVIFYPFFLDAVATDPKLNQRDGMHPTASGVDVIVARILPKVEELVARVRAKARS